MWKSVKKTKYYICNSVSLLYHPSLIRHPPLSPSHFPKSCQFLTRYIANLEYNQIVAWSKRRRYNYCVLCMERTVHWGRGDKKNNILMAKRENKSCVQFLYFNQRHNKDKAKNKTVLMQWIFPMNKSPKTILISNLYILFLYSIKIHHKIIFIWKSIFFSDFINRPKIHFFNIIDWGT